MFVTLSSLAACRADRTPPPPAAGPSMPTSLPASLAASTSSSTPVSPTSGPTGVGSVGLIVEAVHQPVCGPYRPDDPACGPVALDGIAVTVRTPDGGTVASGQTDATGIVRFDVSPGVYEVEGGGDARGGITPERQKVTLTTAAVIVRLVYASTFQ